MVQDTETIIERDARFTKALRSIKNWEDRLEFICNQAVNNDAAKMYGKKVQHCQNNAYILRQGQNYLIYSESRLVSGMMSVFAEFYLNFDTCTDFYKPRFLELLVDIVPDQTINNLLKAFRDA